MTARLGVAGKRLALGRREMLELSRGLKAHRDHPVAKFWGVCNDAKYALDRCFRAEKALRMCDCGIGFFEWGGGGAARQRAHTLTHHHHRSQRGQQGAGGP